MIKTGDKIDKTLLLDFLYSKFPKTNWTIEYNNYSISWECNDEAMRDWFEVKNKEGHVIISDMSYLPEEFIIKDINDKTIVIEDILDDDSIGEQMEILRSDFIEFEQKYGDKIYSDKKLF